MHLRTLFLQAVLRLPFVLTPWVMRSKRTNPLAYQIFGEPDRATGIDIDADADTMQGRAEQVDTVPTSQRLVSHAFLNGGHTCPGGRIRSCLADILSAVAQDSEGFSCNALPTHTPIKIGTAGSRAE